MSARLEAALLELSEAIWAEVRAEAAHASAPPDRLYSLAEACDVLGIRRSRLYVELDAGRLRSPHSGRRRLIPGEAILAYIADRQANV